MTDRWTRIEGLVHEALARGPGERDAFLDAACEGDAALRREAASLLAQASDAGSFLEAPAVAVSAVTLVGRQLGAYRIDARIGAGGMGEVYRARDTKLARDVAIKLLPGALGWDPDRLARLGREARTLAALNHPHIGAIYGLEESDGLRALVLELVDGETLADRIARGPLPIAEARRFAGEIAHALQAAHAKGIVHRDLKPANIKITSGGAVKVLDFGLAKGEASEVEATTLATRDGAVMGTPAYMSPEQARGEGVDPQTDIWAFGCVLYEMLTARCAFGGPTVSDSIAAVLKAEPDWSALPSATPASVRRLLFRCLTKDKVRRLHAIADAHLELEDVRDEGRPDAGLLPTRVSASPRASFPRWLAWSFGAAWVLTLVIVGYLYLRPLAARPPAQTYLYDIPLPAGTKHWDSGGLALSPDGRRLALVTQNESTAVADPRLWIRDLDSTGDWQLVSGAGTEIPQHPFWSPDGRSLAFFVSGNLVRIDGPALVPITICPAPSGRGGVWLDDGTIVFAPVSNGGLQRVDSSRGDPVPLVDLQPGETSLRLPDAAGHGRVIYWAMHQDPTRSEIRLLRLDDPRRATAIVGTRAAGVYDRGTLFYQHAGVWVGQLLDVERARLEGDPRPVALDAPAHASRIVSVEAGHVAVANRLRGRSEVTWVDRSGVPSGTLSDRAAQEAPAISPDGSRVAISRFEPGEAGSSLWILDIETGVKKRLAPSGNGNPIWHRDGTRIAFRSSRGTGGIPNLYQISPDADRPAQPLLEGFVNMYPIDWGAAGDRVVFSTAATPGGTTGLPIGILILEPGAKPTTFRLADEVMGADLSADGTRIAYVVHQTGGTEVLVDTFPVPGPRPVPVAHGAVSNPRWSPSGRELYFVAEGRLMATRVSTGPAPTVETPVRLFDIPSDSYAVHPGGERFLVLVPTSPASDSVKVALNWSRTRDK